MRISSLFAAAGLTIALSACGGNDISETTASETNAEKTMQAAEEGGAMLPKDAETEAGGAMMAPSAEGAPAASESDASAVDQSVQDALAEAEREADAAAE